MKFDFSKIYLTGDVNYFLDDRPLRSILEFIKFRSQGKLPEIGRFVASEIMEDSLFIDHYGKPVLETWSVLDERVDRVWISRTQTHMIESLLEMDVVNSVIGGDLLYHFISGYLISDSGLFCTLTLTAQTAYALRKYGGKWASAFLDKYVGPHGWLGATFYTEIQGGSDLGSNRTLAIRTGENYTLNGENKYFASNAGLADGAIVTARTEGSRPGAKGIAAFFVPALRSDGSLNFEIRRIKDKLGTILVPTGEVVLKNSEGYMLGSEENGIYISLEILEISRIDDAIAAVGIARKALWEAYRYARRRMAFGKPICDHPLLKRDLMEMESEVVASLVISLLAANAFSLSAKVMPPYNNDYHFARALTHIAKNIASWSSDYVTRYAMEVFGGRGFLHEFPVEKFHRDSIVTSLWEGTSNIQALDFIELITKKNAAQLIFSDLENVISRLKGNDSEIASSAYRKLKEKFEKYFGTGNTEYFAKDLLDSFGHTLALTYMLLVSEVTGDNGIHDSAIIFYHRRFTNGFPPDFDFERYSSCLEWMDKPSR
ncbi:MAG: acyl-CoA dehydrogenase family protein [Thermoplasmataceae archaeon]